MPLAAVLIAAIFQAVPQAQPAEDPALRAAVERFFATQEAEDTTAYLALWSRTARPPAPKASSSSSTPATIAFPIFGS